MVDQQGTIYRTQLCQSLRHTAEALAPELTPLMVIMNGASDSSDRHTIVLPSDVLACLPITEAEQYPAYLALTLRAVAWGLYSTLDDALQENGESADSLRGQMAYFLEGLRVERKLSNRFPRVVPLFAFLRNREELRDIYSFDAADPTPRQVLLVGSEYTVQERPLPFAATNGERVILEHTQLYLQRAVNAASTIELLACLQHSIALYRILPSARE